MRALITMLLCVLSLAASCAAQAQTTRRIALVAGNGAYANAPQLKNAPNDAMDLGTTLRGLGFEVIEALNKDKAGIDAALNDFRRRAATADVALFFFSGHALQNSGQNYLVPLDARLTDAASVRSDTIPLDRVMDALNGSKGAKFLILDACRDDPLGARLGRNNATLSTGLAQISARRDMLVAYATQSGAEAFDGTGRNSWFTGALLTHLRQPGLEVNDVFARVRASVYQQTQGRQSPEVATSLREPFYFNEAETDKQVWDQLGSNADAARYRDFIRRFPTSPFVGLAQRIIALEDAAANKTSPLEDQRDKDRQDKGRMARQRALELRAVRDAEIAERAREREAQVQRELLAQKEKEAQAQRERELLAQREREAQAQRELLAQKENEAQAQKERELLAQREREAQAQRELLAQKEKEAQAQRERELLAQKEKEAQAQRERELLAQRERDAQAQRERELLAQRERDAQAQRDLLAQKERDAQARKERELLAQRERDAQAQRERDLQAQRDLEIAAQQQAAQIAESARQTALLEEQKTRIARHIQSERAELIDGLATAQVLALNQPSVPPPLVIPAPLAPDSPELVRLAQEELKRIGCYVGSVNGNMNKGTQAAILKYQKQLGTPRSLQPLNEGVLEQLRTEKARVCPLECGKGEQVKGEQCVASLPPPVKEPPRPRLPAKVDNGDDDEPVAPRPRPRARPAPEWDEEPRPRPGTPRLRATPQVAEPRVAPAPAPAPSSRPRPVFNGIN